MSADPAQIPLGWNIDSLPHGYVVIHAADASADICRKWYEVAGYEAVSGRLCVDSATFQADLDAFVNGTIPPATPEELAAVPAQMAAVNLAASFTTTDEVAAAAEQLHAQAKAGIANFKADIAAWPSLTDAQKLSHVEGLMQSMVGVLQHLTGDYS